MNILDQINASKAREVTKAKSIASISALRQLPLSGRTANSLKKALCSQGASGIIAEFKTFSPSKGMINSDANVRAVTTGYASAGASGLSVLTDNLYFGGSLNNLYEARMANPDMPILRKDFIIDPYQIYEAKAYGADVILLIAASLSKEELLNLTVTAKELGLEVLAEVHSEEDTNRLNTLVDLVGVNNRDLATFTVDREVSVRLSTLLPPAAVHISESGISAAADIVYLRQAGFRGFLIGESFMSTADPARACGRLIEETRSMIENDKM